EALDNEITNIFSKGGTVWLETTAIDQLTSTYEGTEWLDRHTKPESWRELSDSAYRIRFVQLGPGSTDRYFH
ncbi:MAG TPA: hypothetical protein VFU83_06570, partial [Pyrinomonadaceae bacterium]|nr:hypothetical protein [Pyrinomonadaceae bacterium]